MAIPVYLAMTAAEFHHCAALPPRIAWMACHFSPYGTGLSNLPSTLPPDSLLILNDRTPIHGHDPERIAQSLSETVSQLHCAAVLLDFQRQGCSEARAVAARLMRLSCPVAVSEPYAAELECPVFLPPVPLHVPLPEYTAPWQGREIWLDTAADAMMITVTKTGSTFAPLPTGETPECRFYDEELMCHYRIDIKQDCAEFTLRRTGADLAALLETAESHGVTHAVGLYQELHHWYSSE